MSTAQMANPTPSTVPTTDSTRLSASKLRRMRHLDAPSAARTAASRERAVARASIRLATFTQAMSRTNATAPSSINIHDFTGPTIESCSDITETRRSRNQFGYCCVSRAVTASMSARAAARLTPFFSRPSTVALALRRGPRTSSAGFGTYGTHRSMGRLNATGYVKDAGMTPTTVQTPVSKAIVLPRTSGSRANRRLQNASLKIATRSRPATASSATKPRPSAGVARSKGNRLGETIDTRRLSGVLSSRVMNPRPPCTTARSSKLVCIARQSAMSAAGTDEPPSFVEIRGSLSATSPPDFENGKPRSATPSTTE